MKDLQISIIIPHYKSFELLKVCLNSIPKLNIIQVIVVDDNSPDKIKYWENLIRDFPNVVFESFEENKGAGAARNRGLELAKGNWLLFADADDYFTPSAFDVISKYLDCESDIIYFGVDSVDLVTGKSANRHLVLNRYINDYEKFYKDAEDNIRFRWNVPTARMIRRDIVVNNHILFDEVKYSNDIMFSVKVGYYAETILTDRSVIYCITATPNSLVRTKTEEALLCRYKVSVSYNKFLKDIKKEKCQTVLLRYFVLALKDYPSIVFSMLKIAIGMNVSIFSGLWKYLSFKRK